MIAFIDTNIVIYSAGESSLFKKPCLRIIESIAKDEIKGISSVEVYQEVLHWYHSKQLTSAGIKLIEYIDTLISDVLPVTKADVKIAMHLLKAHKNIKCRDAIHAAVMISNNIKYIYSTDSHFDCIDGIERIDPLKES
jgi:predicted nucleic acid-binding protein